jgi:hypothetical protein
LCKLEFSARTACLFTDDAVVPPNCETASVSPFFYNPCVTY